jgi:methylenetetrahydrofolate dehydrogenase (NADP+)/methenyltetrahydrofolate cyclohydrolase
VHTGVPDWADYTRRASIVVAAVGVPASCSPSTSRPARPSSAAGALRGQALLPDVDEACNEVAGAITPRVGGVGPTTVAMLFKNCVEAAERRAGL